MDLSRLRVFLAVMEARSFAKAADILGLSQPGVSKNIKALEEQLDARLFERGRHGAEPTKYAEVIEQRARLIIAESRLIKAEVDAVRGFNKGKISIGVGPNFLGETLPEAVRIFNRRWPDVGIEIKPGISPALFPALQRGELDFVVGIPPTHLLTEEFSTIKLVYRHERKILFGSDHPLTQLNSIGLEDLADYPWVIARGLGDWQKILDIFNQAGIAPPRIGLETASPALGKAVIGGSHYIGAMGVSHFVLEERRGVLTGVARDELFDARAAYVTFRRRSPLSIPARNMVRLIRAGCEVRESHGEIYDLAIE